MKDPVTESLHINAQPDKGAALRPAPCSALPPMVTAFTLETGHGYITGWLEWHRWALLSDARYVACLRGSQECNLTTEDWLRFTLACEVREKLAAQAALERHYEQHGTPADRFPLDGDKEWQKHHN